MVEASERSRPRVLVVDDEESIRTFAERVLRGAGYDVVLASDGPEALRLVDAEPRRFDLFVVDMLMPQMRGDLLGQWLRQRDPGTRVLYFTGFSDRLFEDRKALLQLEAFIEKPVTVKGLQEAVSLLLFGHTRGPESEP